MTTLGPLANEGVSLGTTDAADYDFWRGHFGEIVGNGSALDSSGGIATPEPSGLLLAAIGGLAASAIVRRRHANARSR